MPTRSAVRWIRRCASSASDESDYTGPNVVHWHGAGPGTHLIQVNVGFGGETRWMQKVTDAEYNRR